MFSYEPNGNKPILFEANYSPKHTETTELKDGTLFYHTFPRREEYVFVIAMFDKLMNGFKYIVSSDTLKLKTHELQNKIDIYEFE